MSTRSTLVLFVLAVGVGSVADACSCAHPPAPKKAMEQSTAVFSGKVVSIEKVGAHNHVVVAVDQSWKGPVEPKLTVVTHFSGATCGYGFKKGQKYIVYCYGRPEDETLRTGLCTRTNQLKNAARDLEDLGQGRKPEKD